MSHGFPLQGVKHDFQGKNKESKGKIEEGDKEAKEEKGA